MYVVPFSWFSLILFFYYISDVSENKFYNIILGNLPNNYNKEDVHGLVTEANPVFIKDIEETLGCKL